jgi:hypothetical protein
MPRLMTLFTTPESAATVSPFKPALQPHSAFRSDRSVRCEHTRAFRWRIWVLPISGHVIREGDRRIPTAIVRDYDRIIAW